MEMGPQEVEEETPAGPVEGARRVVLQGAIMTWTVWALQRVAPWSVILILELGSA